jgi:hypothetical protein
MSRVRRPDRLAKALFIARTPRGRHLLDPRRGRETCRAEPPQSVPRKLCAGDAGAAGVCHEPPKALRERHRLRDAAIHLRDGDVSTALGVAPCAVIGRYPGNGEAGNGQAENQRYRCDVSRPQRQQLRMGILLLLSLWGKALRLTTGCGRRDILAIR